MEERDKQKHILIENYINQVNGKNINHVENAKSLNETFKTNYWNRERVRNVVRKYRREHDESTETRILHISDQHYPYNLPKEVYKDYVNKVDLLVFGGDEEDAQSISKFTKKYRVPFVEEMIGTRQMMIDTINYIHPKKVICNYGNHNQRFINYFSTKICEDLLDLMPETNLDLIIDHGFWRYNHRDKSNTFYEPLKKVFDDDIEIQYTRNWWCKIGNTIFAHPKAYRNGILSTTEKAYLYFLENEQKFDTIVLAHTHRQGFARYGKKYLFESGCLCKEPSYLKEGSLGIPQNDGFLYLIQDKNGNLKFDECKIVCLNLEDIKNES